MVKAFRKAVLRIVPETGILAIKDERKTYMTEKDSNLPAFNSDTRIDHYWRSVFEIKTASENSEYVELPSLVKALLAFQNGKSAVEMCLSDSNNCVTSEKVTLLPDRIISLGRMKEYARNHDETHSINITEEMLSGVKEAWRLKAQWQKEEEENTRKCVEEKEKLKQ